MNFSNLSISRLLAVLSLFFLFAKSSMACCARQRYTLTELLNDPSDGRSIFICHVDSTFINPNGAYGSFASLKEVFKGSNIQTKLTILSGGNTTAGGSRLNAGEDYLIFSTGKNGHTFYAFVCDGFSRQVTAKQAPEYVEPSLQIVRQFFKLQKTLYTGKVSFEWEGKTLAEGEFSNGKPHGKWRHYVRYRAYSKDEKLQLRSEVNYREGLLDGICKYYDFYGKGELQRIQVFDNGNELSAEYYRTKDGVTYLCEANKLEKGANGLVYRHRKSYFGPAMPSEESTVALTSLGNTYGIKIPEYPEGPHRAYHENGLLKEEGQYHLGVRVGKWFYYNQLGALQKEEFYNQPDTSIAQFVLFYPSGGVRILGQLVDGKPAGRWIGYFEEDGNTRFAENFKNGLLHGISRSYRSKKNTLYVEENYVNGLKNGAEKHYHEDGTIPSHITHYIAGINEGEDKEWFADGQLKTQGYYKNGERDGDFINYAMPGKVKEKGHYLQGYKHGLFEELGYKDQLSKGEYYFDKKVGTWQYFYPSGKLSAECKHPDKGTHRADQYYFEDPNNCVYYEEDGTIKEFPKKKK